MDRHVGSVDFGVRFAALQYVVIHQSLANLEQDLRAREVRDIRHGLIGHAQDIGVIELDFCP
jgi:hypothetical protein